MIPGSDCCAGSDNPDVLVNVDVIQIGIVSNEGSADLFGIDFGSGDCTTLVCAQICREPEIESEGFVCNATVVENE